VIHDIIFAALPFLLNNTEVSLFQRPFFECFETVLLMAMLITEDDKICAISETSALNHSLYKHFISKVWYQL
jgi:hypothetical protein